MVIYSKQITAKTVELNQTVKLVPNAGNLNQQPPKHEHQMLNLEGLVTSQDKAKVVTNEQKLGQV